MKIGDIVVYTQKAPRDGFPENVRDGVVVDIAPNNIYVRPYNCKCHVCFKPNELRVILPGRLRESKKVQPSKPKKSKIVNEFQTYMDWKAVGRYVRKGERFMKRNEYGECLFHRSQTNCSITEQPNRYNSNYWYVPTEEEVLCESKNNITLGYDRHGEDDVPRGITLGM